MFTAFWLFAAFAFALGAVVGSFLNVVILRYPRGESVVSPGSRCPHCGAEIRWYHNIPIASWIALRGRCHDCGEPISARYPLVEGLMAAMTLALWWKVAARPFAIAPGLDQLPLAAILIPFTGYLLFLGLLVAIATVDLDHYVVPHAFTLPGLAVGLAHPWLVDWFVQPGALYGFWPPVTWFESLVGAVAGAAVVLVIYVGYLLVRGIEGLGGGDATLMALVGAWLGWPALPFVFFAASLQGLVVALASRLGGLGWLQSKAEMYDEPDDDSDKLAVPFGPFIALAAVEHFFLGPWLPPILSSSYLYRMWLP